jgi:CRP-like cAMP-binding protein
MWKPNCRRHFGGEPLVALHTEDFRLSRTKNIQARYSRPFTQVTPIEGQPVLRRSRFFWRRHLMPPHAVRKEFAKKAAASSAVLHTAFPSAVHKTLQEHLVVLRDVGTTLRFSRNETIVREGDPARHVFQLISGTVRQCRHTPDGRRHISDFALLGDLFGVFVDTVQAFTAEAVSDIKVISYPRLHVDRMAECEPRFRANVLKHLSAHLLAAQTHTFVLGCSSAKERLASFIVRHAQRTGVTEGGCLELAMGRQDIADHLGLTIETVCRTFTCLKNEGLLGVPGRQQIALRNIAALCELAEGSLLH